MMIPSVPDPPDANAHRIYSEYLEMPGLRLTIAQTQRLCGLDAAACTHGLQILVDAGLLRRTDADQYVRLSDDPIMAPALRTARTQ